ncbi:AAA family ATPase, partial [Salidesulfovibrio brasiliensis]|uniref:AAA family ATPase n=1 Tax=Salidesulfovibrio brasiliensis TaxID=221711 RepID=UPI0006D28DE1
MTGRMNMTAIVADNAQRTLLGRVAEALPWASMAADDAEHMGVIFYEPGPQAAEDLEQIAQALESGSATDVVLVGAEPAPEVLIEAMRRGFREYLPYPLDPKQVRSVLMRIRSRVNTASEGSENGRISVVLGARPGVGGTTIAVNLATIFAKAAPGKVLLADLARPEGEVPFFLEVACEYTWGDLLEDVSRLDETYLSSTVAEAGNLAVLAAPSGGGSPTPEALQALFETLRSSYPHVIVDASMEPEGHLSRSAEFADDILLVTELTMPSLAAAKKAVDAIRRADPDASRKLKVVASRVTKNGGIEAGDAAEALGCPIDWTVPGVFAEAMAAV